MNSDCAFFTGKSHYVCQDYATSGIKNGLAYAIVSDGCSGSPNTDFGSRFLSLAAVQALDNFESNSEEYFLHVASVAKTQSLSLGLDSTSIDATLLTLTAKDGLVNGSIYGDGFLIVKYQDYDHVHVTSVECTSENSKEFPSYPSYLLDPQRMESWEKINPDGIDIDKYFLDIKNINKTEPTCDKLIHENKTVYTGYRDKWLEISGQIEDIEWIAVASDGTKTFTQRMPGEKPRRIETIEALSSMLDFKGFKGEFIKRQTNWFMRENMKNSWFHDDDLSIAGIYVGD